MCPPGQHLFYAEVGRDADDAKGRADQHKMIEPVRVPGRVQQTDPAAGRVPEQVHPVKPEVAAQRLDVLDEPVDPVRHGICRRLGRARAPVVKQDQRPVITEAAQLT